MFVLWAAALCGSVAAACDCGDLASCGSVTRGSQEVLSEADHAAFAFAAVDGSLTIAVEGSNATTFSVLLESLICVTGDLTVQGNHLRGVDMTRMLPRLQVVGKSLVVQGNSNLGGLHADAFAGLQYVKKKLTVRAAANHARAARVCHADHTCFGAGLSFARARRCAPAIAYCGVPCNPSLSHPPIPPAYTHTHPHTHMRARAHTPHHHHHHHHHHTHTLQISANTNLKSMEGAFPNLLHVGYDAEMDKSDTDYEDVKPMSLGIYQNEHLADLRGAFPRLVQVEQMLLLSNNAAFTFLDGAAFASLVHTRGGVYINQNPLLSSLAGSFPRLLDAYLVFLHGNAHGALDMAGAFPRLRILQDDLEIKGCGGDVLGLDTAFAALEIVGDFLVRKQRRRLPHTCTHQNKKGAALAGAAGSGCFWCTPCPFYTPSLLSTAAARGRLGGHVHLHAHHAAETDHHGHAH